MNNLNIVRKSDWVFGILLLLFIFSPVLSAQADAHPGAFYVMAIVFPMFFLAIGKKMIIGNNANLYVVLLFVFGLISTAFSNITDFRIETFLKYIVFVVFFISASSYVPHPKVLKFAFGGYLLLSITLSVLIVLSFIFGFTHIEDHNFQGRYSIGITGLYKNPNYLTSFYNIAFFVISYILATIKVSFKLKCFLFSTLLLFLVSSFFSGTRAALLVNVLVMVSLLIIGNKKHFIKYLPICFFIFFILLYFSDTINTLLNLFLGNRDAFSDESRFSAWVVVISYLEDNFILGCGNNSWGHISHGSSFIEYLHNVLLELVLDEGLIGFVLFIALIFNNFNRTNRNDRTYLLLFLLFSTIPICFQNGLYEVNFWRYIIINRLMMNISIKYNGGINSFLKKSYGKV